jgi:hypothetical protein
VVLSNPAKTRAIAEAKAKTDKVGAATDDRVDHFGRTVSAWVSPVMQARLGDPEILRGLPDWLVPQAGQLDRTLTKLRRVCCGHPNSSVGDQCRLSDGVRETGEAQSVERVRPNSLRSGGEQRCTG